MAGQTTTKTYNAALYCRLSRDDGNVQESSSIQTQKEMLMRYARENGISNTSFYVDDGYSGTNYNRPDFQRMLSDIESGKINCVITKDLSRLGRNYLETGVFIEVYFPEHNVRYIAVNDVVDTDEQESADFTPFRNIINDMYSRDISKKVLAGRMTRSRQGKFYGGQPPLGLMRDPDDNGHLIIDPETAPIIRRIFDLALDGFGNMKICKVLMEERIPITRMQTGTDCDVNYYAWSGSRISTILRNPFYKGAHVVCKTHQKGIRSNTYNIIPREQREVIEDCHEAIIPKAEWDKVQQLIDRRPPIMKGNSCPYYNIFHGIVYCATCGKSMQVRYEKVGRTNKDRRTGKEREPIDKAYYICQTYNRLGKNACTSHKIEARDLYNLVLADIQEVAAMALKDKEVFYGRLSRRMEKQYLADTDSLKKEYENLAQRNQEIDDTFISLYADKAKGILTEKRFLKLTDAMEKEQESNQNRMQEIAALISEEEHSEGDVQMFMGEIRRYAAITELDETVLNRLINCILIGEPKKVDRVKTQEVRIVYNFVGEL